MRKHKCVMEKSSKTYLIAKAVPIVYTHRKSHWKDKVNIDLRRVVEFYRVDVSQDENSLTKGSKISKWSRNILGVKKYGKMMPYEKRNRLTSLTILNS